MSIAERYLKKTKNKYAYILTEDGFPIREYIDTGNYVLNALISSDVYGGMPSNKVVELAGPPSTGKTYISINTIIQAQKARYEIFYYDTEAAQMRQALIDRGVDPKLFVHIPIATVHELKTDILNLIQEVKDEKIMIVVDSIGNLITTKEFEDSMSGKEVRDMTRAGELKSFCRTIAIPSAAKNVPIVLVNHVYANIGGYGPKNKQSGGSGPEYISSTIIELTKSKEKLSNGTVIGAAVKCKSVKNRIAKENEEVTVVIDYNRGLTKYSGLFEFALEYGIIKKVKQGFYSLQIPTPEEGSHRKSHFSGAKFWDGILEEGTLVKKLNERFKYQSQADGILEDDDELDPEIESLDFEIDEDVKEV